MLRITYPAFFLYNNNSEERADSQFSYINNPPFIIFPDLLPENYNKLDPKDERFETTGRSIGIIDETDAAEPLAETMLRAQRTLGKTLARYYKDGAAEHPKCSSLLDLTLAKQEEIYKLDVLPWTWNAPMYSKTFTSYVTADVDQYLKPEDRPYINRYFTISWPAYRRWQDSDAVFNETLHKTFENFVNKALAREIMVKSLPEYLREKTEIKD